MHIQMMRVIATIVAACAGLGVTVVPGMSQATSPELDQGWNSSQRDAWYEAAQGSRLIPLKWLHALEQPDNDALFMAADHVNKFRYIPRKHSEGHDLAIGFAIDKNRDTDFERTRLRWKAGQADNEPWVGLTCSACHTAELSFEGKKVRIDGAPALADFQLFVETLNKALRETVSNPGKWNRFATRVIGNADQTLLKKSFEKLLAWQEREEKINESSSRYGFGRVDAFGHIYNKVSLLVEAANPKKNPSDAPVSIPYLWNITQFNHVQYNGMAPKKMIAGLDLGALARNTGEVIGVFGDVKIKANPRLSGFKSSVNIEKLIALEDQLKSLRAPKWPDTVFGKPDDALVAAGKQKFAAQCAECHVVWDRTNLADPIQLKMNLFAGPDKFNPRTDPSMACNAFIYKTPSGLLKGIPSKYIAGESIKETDEISDLLTVTVVGTFVGKARSIIEATAASFFGIQRPLVIANAAVPTLPQNANRSPERAAQLLGCLATTAPNLGYVSRPLNGIWATAPYLHNGSVPSLYDLLLPPGERPKEFYLGTREFDPKKVGYRTDKEASGNTFKFETQDANGQVIDGNWNAGHDYENAKLSPDDRSAIIAYLKTL